MSPTIKLLGQVEKFKDSRSRGNLFSLTRPLVLRAAEEFSKFCKKTLVRCSIVCLLFRPTARKRFPFKSTKEGIERCLIATKHTHLRRFPTFASCFFPKRFTFFAYRRKRRFRSVHLRAEIIVARRKFMFNTYSVQRASVKSCSCTRMFGTFVEMSLDKPLFAFSFATFFCNRRVEKYARGYVGTALDAIN